MKIHTVKRVLHIGLGIFGTGILALFAAGFFGGRWGPFGPSSISGLVLFLVAVACIPVGTVVLIVALFTLLFQKLC